MTRYASSPDSTLVRELDTLRIADGRHGVFVIVTHAAGPYSDPHSSLIPEATVIDGRAKPAPNHVLYYGDVIDTVLGPHRITRTDNPDWPRLVPMYGQRFYVHFEGGDQYSIRDRLNGGTTIPYATKAEAADAVFGLGRPLGLPRSRTTNRPNVVPCTLAAHNALAAYLSAVEPGDLGDPA